MNSPTLDKHHILLDNATEITIEAIWKELVQECIDNSKSNAKSNASETVDGWVLVKRTKIAEPLWGKVVNK